MSPLTESTRLTLAQGQPVPNDPYLYTNTVLLLHGDGTNGSTTILDSSKVVGGPKAVTAVGNAQISTAQSKFGGASIAFDGTGDYLTVPTSSAFAYGLDDFTVEMWLFRVGSGQQHLYEGRQNSATNRFLFYLNSSNQLTYYANGAVVIASTAVPTANAWSHVAVTRASGTTKMFLDGTQAGSSYSDTISYAAPTSVLYFGCNDVAAGSFLNGYIDDLRITKGVARYTSNFTPPTLPFPDF